MAPTSGRHRSIDGWRIRTGCDIDSDVHGLLSNVGNRFRRGRAVSDDDRHSCGRVLSRSRSVQRGRSAAGERSASGQAVSGPRPDSPLAVMIGKGTVERFLSRVAGRHLAGAYFVVVVIVNVAQSWRRDGALPSWTVWLLDVPLVVVVFGMTGLWIVQRVQRSRGADGHPSSETSQ